MAAEIRTGSISDLPSMVDLLMQDARLRQARDPYLWRVADDAHERIAASVSFAMTAESQPFRQQWLVAEHRGRLVGLTHTLRLPVPPIYAGKWGDPGLILPETIVAEDAPEGTIRHLLRAAEADLRASGASFLLASIACGDELASALGEDGYTPLTLYLSKTGLTPLTALGTVRQAREADIGGIVTRSAENRAILHGLDPFWAPHTEADSRFGNWMNKSLGLSDRDMLVSGAEGAVDGYVVAQPASRLHFPPAHDTSATGFIDDYFHSQFAVADEIVESGDARMLLQAAEGALAARGVDTVLVVCPAAWTSKVSLLENMGYKTAMVWMRRG